MAMSNWYEFYAASKKISKTTADVICDAPGFAYMFNLENIRAEDWVRILIKFPSLSDLCPFDKFDYGNWADLLHNQKVFVDQCPWHKLHTTAWCCILDKEKTFLKFLKLEYISSAQDLQEILQTYYSPNTNRPYSEFITEEKIDPASYLIYKRINPVDGKLFLDKQFTEERWEFLEALYDFAPEETFDVHNKRHLPFFITLRAPDDIFKKCLPSFNIKNHDQGGNTLLLPALLYSIHQKNMARYNFMLDELKFNPDEKNLAGFSCNDLYYSIKDVKTKNKEKKYAY